MSKHTPGRWQADAERALVLDEDGNFVAKCGESHFIPQKQVEANVALIAAAPEMLEALADAYPLAVGWAAQWQFQHNQPEFHATHQGIIDRIKAALEKAGVTP
jgi:hypothetical protein